MSNVVIPCGFQHLGTQLSSTFFIWLKEGHNSTTDPHWYMTFFHSNCGPIKQTITIRFQSNIFILGQFRKCKRNTWKVSKCGARGGWRSVRLIMWNMQKYYKESRLNEVSYIKQKGQLSGMVTSCVQNVVEGRTEVTWIRKRWHKQIMNDLKEKRGYWKLKLEALNSTHIGRSCGSVI